MSRFTPKWMMITGIILLLLGFFLPLFMVVKLIPASLALSFISHACSVIGIFFGFYGLFSYIRIQKK